jgi:hypothetical protein
MVSHPRRIPDPKTWLADRIDAGDVHLIPDVADYEVRRELLRVRKSTGIYRLDALGATLGVFATTPEVLREAAQMWATARQRGRPTAVDAALDIDVIIAAQAREIEREGHVVPVATTNVAHLAQFVDAKMWADVG